VSTDEPTGPAPTAGPVVVRFWAGARRAAGHAEESAHAATVGELRAQLSARPALRPVVAVASYLVDSLPATDATLLTPGAVVDVLPPFAGGSTDPAIKGS
jgi:molybdopterin synthase sulfur carrier subunit